MKVISKQRLLSKYFGHTYMVTVTESATNWYITLQRLGWALPSLLDYRVAKRAAKTAEEAINMAFNQGLSC